MIEGWCRWPHRLGSQKILSPSGLTPSTSGQGTTVQFPLGIIRSPVSTLNDLWLPDATISWGTWGPRLLRLSARSLSVFCLQWVWIIILLEVRTWIIRSSVSTLNDLWLPDVTISWGTWGPRLPLLAGAFLLPALSYIIYSSYWSVCDQVKTAPTK